MYHLADQHATYQKSFLTLDKYCQPVKVGIPHCPSQGQKDMGSPHGFSVKNQVLKLKGHQASQLLQGFSESQESTGN